MSNEEKQDTNTLIDSLCGELKPVQKAKHPFAYTLPWLAITAAFAFFVVRFVGVRHDVIEQLSNPVFLFETITVALLAVIAAISSAYLMIPDMRGKKWLLSVTFTIAGIFVLWNIVKMSAEGFQLPRFNFDHCMREGMFLALLPMMALIFFMRAGATTKPVIMAVMNLLAGASIAYIGLRFTCSMDTVGHALVFHLVPYMFIGALIGLVARRLYKW